MSENDVSREKRKSVRLYNSITNIDTKYIEEAQRLTPKKAKSAWRFAGRAAVIVLAAFLFGGTAAMAASPELRQAVIAFFTSGVREGIPYEEIEGGRGENEGAFSVGESEGASDSAENEGASGSGESEEASGGGDVDLTVSMDNFSVTVGDLTLTQECVLDQHIKAIYASSDQFLGVTNTASGRSLIYTRNTESGETTYYQIADGQVRMVSPVAHSREGSVSLGSLPGVMKRDEGENEYPRIVLPEMRFTVKWQELDGEVLLLDSGNERFDIGDTFGGTLDGESIAGMYDGRFGVSTLRGESDWVVVHFHFDGQITWYSYPFLFNLQTGEVKDPLRAIDLSAYPCITELAIRGDGTQVTAMAGENHDSLRGIEIDLESGAVTEEPFLEPPVKDCFTFSTTSDHTVFYMVGEQESVDGFIYDTETGETKELFQGAAAGYVWDYGFADTYIRLIGHHYGVYYKEPENEVYLLDMVDGDMSLLEGIPANHRVHFFWNNEGTLLSITVREESGEEKLAFYLPGTEKAWYLDRDRPEEIKDKESYWCSEYGYCREASSEDGRNYLYMYEFMP